MSWIKVIDYEEADDDLKEIYDKVKGPNNNIDNVLLIHSQRPHTLLGHMALYKSVLHNSNNTLPKWYLEAIGVYVSHLNKCSYCVQHHFEGLKKILKDDEKADSYYNAMETNFLSKTFNQKYSNGLVYAKKLTLDPSSIVKEYIYGLRTAGFTEGQILEINQVASYFNYVNRMVLGLGVETKGDILGMSPNDSDDPDNWTHS